MIPLNVTNLEEVPEAIRSLCVADAEGKVSLDETKVKTPLDVERALEAKRKANVELSEAKAALNVYRSLGDPDDIKAVIEKPDNATEIKKQLRLKEKELADLQPKLAEYNTLLASKREQQVRQKVHSIINKLPQDYDRARLTALSEDYLGKFQLDDTGELAPIGDQTVEDYLKSRADIFNMKVSSTPGVVSASNQQPGAYTAALQTGDLNAAIANAPAVK